MKNKILVAIIIGLIVICTGCAKAEETPYQSETSMFIKVEDSGVFGVVYNKETKVMYAISQGVYNCGSLTLLVNADGSPMIYRGE
ncbi:MAG: hypothetical protein E7253_12110 [Lachnospiraceae bacterium]|nr:hypothetical protein [Lachnospiraceae bacterium]